MKSFLKSTGNKRGSAFLEYAILSLVVSTACTSAVLTLLAEPRELIPPKLSESLPSPDPVGDCLSFTEGPDIVTPRAEHTCYDLLGGADRFNGSSDMRHLEVRTRDYTKFTGSILTGGGNDIVTSAQNGLISTGAGDDQVTIDLTSHPLHSRYELSLGMGNDQATIKAGRRPEGAPVNSLIPGPGSSIVSANCAHNPMALSLQSYSSLVIDGPCEYQVAVTGVDAISTTFTSPSGISGLFDKIDDLTFSASGSYHEVKDYSLVFSRSDNVDIDIDLASPGPLALVFEDIAPFGNDVDIKITSPNGFLSFLGAGGDAWSAEVNYSDGGMITLLFPEGKSFADIQFPTLSGQASHMRIMGCFDALEALLADGSVVPLPACETNETPVGNADNIRRIRATLGGQSDDLDLQNISISNLRLQRP